MKIIKSTKTIPHINAQEGEKELGGEDYSHASCRFFFLREN